MSKDVFNIPYISSEYHDPDEIANIIRASKKNNPQAENNKNYSTCLDMIYVDDYDSPRDIIFKLQFRRVDGDEEFIEDAATGFMVHPRLILTVAHSLIDGSKKWYDSVIITPVVVTKNHKCTYPLGGEVSRSFCMNGDFYINNQNYLKDYGAIFLSDDTLFKKLNSQPFDLKVMPTGTYDINLAGYEKKKCIFFQNNHLQHAKVGAKIHQNHILHKVDSDGGQSGMPIWIVENNNHLVIGINNRDCNAEKVKITNETQSNINNWKSLIK